MESGRRGNLKQSLSSMRHALDLHSPIDIGPRDDKKLTVFARHERRGEELWRRCRGNLKQSLSSVRHALDLQSPIDIGPRNDIPGIDTVQMLIIPFLSVLMMTGKYIKYTGG